jgi:hypothetical protein
MSTILSIGSLWKFRGLEDPVLFEVVAVTGDRVFYRTAGDSSEEATDRSVSNFSENFIPCSG